MKKTLENLGAAVLMLIPITSLSVLFGFTTFPNGHRYMGYLVGAYLALVVILHAREHIRERRGRRKRP